MCNIQFLGIKIADSASVMKHRPLLSIIQFVNRLSTVLRLFSASTKFLPSFIQLVFYRVSTRILQNACIFRTALLRCFWAFYHPKAQWNRNICVTQCDSVVLSVKLVCLYHISFKNATIFLIFQKKVS